MTERSRSARRFRPLLYWATTLVIAAESLLGGVWDVLRTDYVRDVLESDLSYPHYVAIVIGVCKLPAAFVLVIPRFPRLKEWVYAGVAFIYISAVASHLATGDVVAAIGPLGFALITMTSWWLRPPERREPSAGSWILRRPYTRASAVIFWTTTATILGVMVSGGIADLIRRPETAAGMVDLGYPLYFVTIIGTWKILGALAIAPKRFHRLKEWAYAGAFYNFAGACASHLYSGSEWWHVAYTALFAAFTLASWAYRPPNRILGAAPVAPVREAARAASGGTGSGTHRIPLSRNAARTRRGVRDLGRAAP